MRVGLFNKMLCNQKCPQCISKGKVEFGILRLLKTEWEGDQGGNVQDRKRGGGSIYFEQTFFKSS